MRLIGIILLAAATTVFAQDKAPDAAPDIQVDRKSVV